MCAGAAAVADFLSQQPGIARVLYPARADHPQHDLAMRQMSAGGTIVSFEVAGGKQAAFALLDRLRLIRISNNLGDSKSLATHPATTTHMRIGAEEREKLGITDGLIRLSIGLEDPADLTDDLGQALHAAEVALAAE
jgi:O-succinylhomoserine sulfhydrylase